MALIIDRPMPKNCIDCEIAHNGFTFCCAVGDSVKDEGIDSRCPIVKEVNLDKYIRVLFEEGDGTIVGYKDVPIRELLGLSGKSEIVKKI